MGTTCKTWTPTPPERLQRLSTRREEAHSRRACSEKANTGPSRCTRSQAKQSQSTQGEQLSTQIIFKPTKGHVAVMVPSPGCYMTVVDGTSKLQCHGRCDDGSDETLVSPRIAEKAVIQSIGRLHQISPITVQVALKDEKAQTFTFSRTWKVPRLVLQLAAGQRALLNVNFLVADADLIGEDMLIGRPVQEHLGVHSKTVL